MPKSASKVLVGCLLDVSGSMRGALEPRRSENDGQPLAGRLRAVLRAALKLAQAEERHEPDALIFVGLFGLNLDREGPPILDLCGAADALLGNSSDGASGHELLIRRANRENRNYVAKYIRTKLTNDEARIVDGHLARHPEKVQEFVDAIPPEAVEKAAIMTGTVGGSMAGAQIGSAFGPLGMAIGTVAGATIGIVGSAVVVDSEAEHSTALQLARTICAEWLQDFSELIPRPVAEVVSLLERLQRHSDTSSSASHGSDQDSEELESLKRYMYGKTPMRQALEKSLGVFAKHALYENRVLVLVSDGLSTDGDPSEPGRQLRRKGVSIATVYLTDRRQGLDRRLYYKEDSNWNNGQLTLFRLAARVSGVSHPIPVLTSVGWEVPSEGEVALHATVSSTMALDEFCSLLLSARFGAADSLLDIVGRIRQDEYVNDEQVRTCSNPSDQGHSMTCYAHAIAAVIHMSLLRIVGRDGGHPDIETIRKRILNKYPPEKGGRNITEVLEAAIQWYRPLRVKPVDGNGARQAVLRRRPVLAAFSLSQSGWAEFSKHFRRKPPFSEDSPILPVLTCAKMAPHRSSPRDGGHAVVLTGCNPTSLTFLNSWGRLEWGNNGSFSVEDHTVLEVDIQSGGLPMQFYDVYWVESELTGDERQAFDILVDEELSLRLEKHPGLRNLEAQCPHCRRNAPMLEFRGNVRRARCPLCHHYFSPKAQHLLEALYVRGEAEAGVLNAPVSP
ncbi:hypothetical protein RB595_010170 [Gaeumannomyces hyphopodioides]